MFQHNVRYMYWWRKRNKKFIGKIARVFLFKYSKKYAAHDENNMAHVGDKVRLAQTRPLSKTKRYELVEVIEKAVIL